MFSNIITLLARRAIMHIKSIVPVIAIASVAALTVGSASAAEQFTTLEGIPVEALSALELGLVVGGLHNEFPQIIFPEGHPADFNVPHLDPAVCAGITNSRAFTVSVCG